MEHCHLVAIFWRNGMRVLSAVRICSGNPMAERDCRDLANIVKTRMGNSEAEVFYQELENRIDIVELYVVSLSAIGDLDTVEKWQRNFQAAIGSGAVAIVTSFRITR